MKAIIKIYLCFFLCISTIIGCTKEETIIEKEETNKESFTSVSFAFKGEVLNITESPLTKAADYKDWYAFQVYSRTEGSSDSYRYYAGFFDNIQDMVINLKDGYEYKFDVFMLPEGSRRVALFSLTKSGQTLVDNSFHISSTEAVRYMYEGYLYMKYPFSVSTRVNTP